MNLPSKSQETESSNGERTPFEFDLGGFSFSDVWHLRQVSSASLKFSMLSQTSIISILSCIIRLL